MGNNILRIGSNAFQGTKLSSITMPESLVQIDYGVFQDCNIKDFHFKAKDVDKLKCDSCLCGRILVPIGTKDVYKRHKIFRNYEIIEEN